MPLTRVSILAQRSSGSWRVCWLSRIYMAHRNIGIGPTPRGHERYMIILVFTLSLCPSLGLPVIGIHFAIFQSCTTPLLLDPIEATMPATEVVTPMIPVADSSFSAMCKSKVQWGRFPTAIVSK